MVMPIDAPRNKVAKALGQGARVIRYDRSKQSREELGMRLLAETGGTLIPPGDHPDVLAAQRTEALEALRDLPGDVRDSLAVFAAPCGGGGLIAGCALALQALAPSAQSVPFEPVGFDDTVRSLSAGTRVSNGPGNHSF